jgi:hypothetical protein
MAVVEELASDVDLAIPSPKRVKLSKGVSECFLICQRLLLDESKALPTSLLQPKTGNDIARLRRVFDEQGFRTSIVSSPRQALSVYKDSCTIDDKQQGKDFLVLLVGLHPRQLTIERCYSVIKDTYCLLLFCARLQVCSKALESEALAKLVGDTESSCRAVANMSYQTALDETEHLSPTERSAHIMQLVVHADPGIRIEQLQHEYERILIRNSTLSNAFVQLFCNAHECCIKDVYFKQSHVAKYERLTFYLYDPEIDLLRPNCFMFLPSLTIALTGGAEPLAKEMIDSFWVHLLRQGYFATSAIKAKLTPNLEKFFQCGIAKDLTIPLQLNAHFTPAFPLSYYFYGAAGAGKSGLARNLSPAINATLEEHVDPEIIVRFVKQTLNKPFDVLKLELELRPNNNGEFGDCWLSLQLAVAHLILLFFCRSLGHVNYSRTPNDHGTNQTGSCCGGYGGNGFQ